MKTAGEQVGGPDPDRHVGPLPALPLLPVEVELHGPGPVVDVEADGEPLQPDVARHRAQEREVVPALHTYNKICVTNVSRCLS